MKGNELIKKALESDMPDMEAVQKKCIEELHKGKEKREKSNKKKTNRKRKKSIYGGLGVCAAIWLCVLNLPAKTGAESLIARLQTWLHLKHERVQVGEMEKTSIRIPEDCEEVEYGGETYLTKRYTSVEELEEDIGKHVEVWRGVSKFEKEGILLRIVKGEYARLDVYYDIWEGEVLEVVESENTIQDLECYITIPLSKNFSMNDIKLQDRVLKDATLDNSGNLVSYGRNGDYSLLERYYSERLAVEVSVIEKKKMENIDKEKDMDTSYYDLYFVYQGLSYHITCQANLDTVKAVVEELE